MQKAEQDYLKQIQATLMEISTKGQDTLMMGECLRAIGVLTTMPINEEEEEKSVEPEVKEE